jgi:hypothetical protein
MHTGVTLALLSTCNPSAEVPDSTNLHGASAPQRANHSVVSHLLLLLLLLQIPLVMFLMTHAYFLFYHALANLVLRRVRTVEHMGRQHIMHACCKSAGGCMWCCCAAGWSPCLHSHRA